MTDTLEEYVKAQLTSFDDIIRNVDNIPLDRIELSGLIAAVKQWRGDGYPVAIGSLSWAALKFSREQVEQSNLMAITAGWLPFNFGWDQDNMRELRLLKVKEGRTLLGRAKVSYRLYSCLDSGRFIFESSHRSSAMAMWALNKMLIESFGPTNI